MNGQMMLKLKKAYICQIIYFHGITCSASFNVQYFPQMSSDSSLLELMYLLKSKMTFFPLLNMGKKAPFGYKAKGVGQVTALDPT